MSFAREEGSQPERLVVCGGLAVPKGAAAGVLELDKNPNALPNKRIELKLNHLSEQLVDNIPPVLCDAVEVAAYVFMADRLISRGTDQMGKMNAKWRRRLRFRIPVRALAVWNSAEVRKRLSDTLNFLSDDEFSFNFELGDPVTRLDPFLGFEDSRAHRVQPDDVILFSGGLDSLSGAVDQLIRLNRSAVLVTHKSATNLAARQDALAERLAAKARGGMFYAPVWVRKGDYEPIEHTQRTRSFLYITLGVAVARMFDRDSVLFFENGITTFNLPIAEHIIGTMASRTTHPKVLASFSDLFSLLLQRTVTVENKYIWHTKRDVIASLARSECGELIGATTSCASVRNLSMTAKQCGVCSQCIERRFGILAAGLEGYELSSAYETDPFVGPHGKPAHVTLAEQHISRAARLSAMNEHQFLSSYGQVFRALRFLPGTPHANAQQVFELHRRYGGEVMGVVNEQLKKASAFDSVLTLPATSLLAMINAPVGVEISPPNLDSVEPPASVQAAADPTPVKDRRLFMAIDAQKRSLLLPEGIEVTGASYQLVARLAEQFRIDLAAGKLPAFYDYVTTATLTKHFQISDHTLRQRVLRMRIALREKFAAKTGYVLDDDDIVQNRQWQGYRLNPYIRLVAPHELRVPGRVTAFEGDVTTRP